MSEATVRTERTESEVKKAIVYVDMSDLYRNIMASFGEKKMLIKPLELSEVLIEEIRKHENYAKWTGLDLIGVRLYVSYPEEHTHSVMHQIWRKNVHYWRKVLKMDVYAAPHDVSRALIVSENKEDGAFTRGRIFSESNVRISLAADMVDDACTSEADVFVLVSKDRSFAPLADKIRSISAKDGRWMKIINAFPYQPSEATNTFHRGIPSTDWFHITEDMWNRFKNNYTAPSEQ